MTESEAKYIADLEAANLEMAHKIQQLKNVIKKPTRCNPADLALYEALLSTFYVFCGADQIEPDSVSEYLRIELQTRGFFAGQKGKEK